MKTVDITNELEYLLKSGNRAKLDVLTDLLMSEYKQEEARLKGGNADEIRLAVVDRMLKQNRQVWARRKLKKGFVAVINGERMQVFCTPYYMVALKSGYEVSAEMWTTEEIQASRFDVQHFFDRGNLKFSVVDYDLAEIKAYYKYWEAEKKPNLDEWEQGDRCILHLGNVSKVGYNADYVINCVEALGGDVTFLQSKRVKASAFLESESGLAIIQPYQLG